MVNVVSDEVVDAWGAAADAEFRVTSRCAELPRAFYCDSNSRRLQITEGRINCRAYADESTLTLRATSACWLQFLQAVAPRFHRDVMGMQRRPAEFSIEGRTTVMQRYVALLHRVCELARTVRADRG